VLEGLPRSLHSEPAKNAGSPVGMTNFGRGGGEVCADKGKSRANAEDAEDTEFAEKREQKTDLKIGHSRRKNA